MDEFIKFARELGFPAAVAIFVLWRLDARLADMQAELHRVCEALWRLRGQYRGSAPPDDQA